MKKIFSFCLICVMALSASAQQMEFVDLGLPSGTLWKAVDEPGFYTYDEATSKLGDQLPTNVQLEELKKECVWSWNGNGYHVTGPNGNFITLPASISISFPLQYTNILLDVSILSNSITKSVSSVYLL